MKRKSPAPADEVIAREILAKAKEYLQAEASAPRPGEKCVVCGAECAPNSLEKLCWVCRRLKISAWRDSDTQLSAQE